MEMVEDNAYPRLENHILHSLHRCIHVTPREIEEDAERSHAVIPVHRCCLNLVPLRVQ
jgi:hypothetical protein